MEKSLGAKEGDVKIVTVVHQRAGLNKARSGRVWWHPSYQSLYISMPEKLWNDFGSISEPAIKLGESYDDVKVTKKNLKEITKMYNKAVASYRSVGVLKPLDPSKADYGDVKIHSCRKGAATGLETKILCWIMFLVFSVVACGLFVACGENSLKKKQGYQDIRDKRDNEAAGGPA